MRRDSQAYEILVELHEKNNLLVSPSEIQGVIFGYLATTEEPCFESWTQEVPDLFEWNSLSSELQDHIKNMFLAAHLEIVQSAENFVFIAPESQKSLPSQLSAISDWARGCLYGIGLGHFSHDFFENPELEEALNDLAQIAQIDLDQEQESNLQEDLEYCFKHIEAIVSLLYQSSKEFLEEERSEQ